MKQAKGINSTSSNVANAASGLIAETSTKFLVTKPTTDLTLIFLIEMKHNRPPRKQHTSVELRDSILHFIQTHFYPGQNVMFYKHTPDLLKWVVLKLAAYLDDKAVSIPTDRYLEIMVGNSQKPGILMQALQFGDTGNITYLPGYLGICVERHLKIHGEDYYEEGKALRNHIDGALALAHKGIQGRDPIRELADASRLLKSAKKQPFKPASKAQLSLFK